MNRFRNFSLLAAASLALVAVPATQVSASSFACGVLQFCPNVLPDGDGDFKTSNMSDQNDPPPSFRNIPGLPPEIGQPYDAATSNRKRAIVPTPCCKPVVPGQFPTHFPIENLPPELSQPWSTK